MKIILIDGTRIDDIDDLHDEFSKVLGFPDWYGRNMDALYDELCESSEMIGVIAVNTKELSEKLGKRWNAFLRLMSDVERENSGFYFCCDPFGID